MKLYVWKIGGEFRLREHSTPPPAHGETVAFLFGVIEVTEPKKEMQSTEELATEALRISQHIVDVLSSLPEVPKPAKPKEPIKMTIPIIPPDDAQGTFTVHLELPADAKNIRCTFDLEE